jgi:hypothetical protein
MDWLEAEFKALTEVISGASDFAAAFSVESILKILHDYDCVDLEKFRANLSQSPALLVPQYFEPTPMFWLSRSSSQGSSG